MKTEKKKVFVFVREHGGETSIEASSREWDSTYCSDITKTVSAPLCEMEIDVPSISSKEAQKVLSGALLENLIDERENLIDEREKLRAESHVKLSRLNGRIDELQAIEYKGDSNE